LTHFEKFLWRFVFARAPFRFGREQDQGKFFLSVSLNYERASQKKFAVSCVTLESALPRFRWSRGKTQ
jgi:hypothetical protein